MKMTEPLSLQTIRRQLRQLGRVRRGRQWLCALSTLLTLLLWGLGVVVFIDVLFQLDVLQRVTVFLLVAAALCWAMIRFVRPYFARPETEAELALLVERLHGIDTDLVAAIEFMRPEADSWGSATLREQVVTDVARRGQGIEMARAVDQREPRQRLRILFITMAVAAVLLVVFPQYLPIFMRRLALADDHYPSHTVIASIVLNGQLVLQPQDSLSPRPARCPERGPIEFQVHCSRHAPASGELLISEVNGSRQHHVPLTRRDSHDQSDQTREIVFVARLPMLFDSLQYQVYLGDAWTNPGLIELVPLPQIEIHTAVFPPDYTDAQESSVPNPGARRITVLEGSRVELSVSCANKKRLQSVWAELRTSDQSERQEFACVDNSGVAWQLDSAALPLLQRIQETVRFTIHAIDQDGLQPARSLQGEIRVQPDLPPDAIAVTIHDVVLPSAQPRIAVRVDDDFAIGRLRLRIQIQRRPDSQTEPADESAPPEVHWLDFKETEFPIRSPQLPYLSHYVLDLKPWTLHKGDRIKVTLETTDYRGPVAGASVKSKPLYLEVSDQAGVLAAILSADHRAEQDLDEMIQRQLGLGE